MSMSAYEKFITTLQRLSNRFPWISYIMEQIERGNFRIWIPNRVEAKHELDSAANLGYYWCSRCGWVGISPTIIDGRPMCPSCNRRSVKIQVVQAYVGAPKAQRRWGGNRVIHINVGGRGGSDYIILPISAAINTYCRHLRKFKNLQITNRERPVASLRFSCPNPNYSCGYRADNNLCTEEPKTLIFRRSIDRRYFPSHLSEGLTKAFVVSTYDTLREIEVSFENDILPGIDSIYLVKVKIYEVCIAILFGHQYSRYSERIVALPSDDYGPCTLARHIETEGLLFKLKPEYVERAKAELSNKHYRSDSLIVLHTFSHAVLNTMPILTGLSPFEFGESVWASDDSYDYEVLIYDDSKGSIGGVRSVISNHSIIHDLYAFLVNVDCRRGCETACRACLFFERCGMLNRNLNRHALTSLIDLDKCRELYSVGISR